MKDSILSSKRNQQILAQIVQAYVTTGEPVSSRAISKSHAEQLSSASIRNVMADLEAAGLLFQPHTSAGRVPTAAGHPFFAQQIAAQAKLNEEDKNWLRTELECHTKSEA